MKVLILLLCISISSLAQTGKKSENLVFKTRPKGEIVSEAVAQAGNHVVTSREVQISSIFDQSLATPNKKAAEIDRKNWLVEAKTEAFNQALAQVLLELVVQMEAENFAVGQVSQEDIQTYEKHAQEQVKDWKPWQELEVSELERQQILMRKLRARNFLKFKTESSGVQISDDEAKRYYEKNRVKFGNSPFAQFREHIKEALAQTQLQEKLKDWFEILKRKYRVHYLGQSG
jgi:hypothetical protein